MIVFDENVHQRSSMDAVAAWYRGRVISVTVLRPGTIIKDEAIPTLLRRVLRPTFVTTNAVDSSNIMTSVLLTSYVSPLGQSEPISL